MTFIIFILVISVLIFVHELGHFVMAKRAGMKVEEFGFGFPPALWSTKRGETKYSINAIPFGGFVKIFGEDGDSRSESRSFGSKSFGARMAVIVAGVAMNFVFAALLLMLGNGLGLRIGLIGDTQIRTAHDKKVQIIQVTEGSPAAAAGLQVFDAIQGFKQDNGTFVPVANVQEVQDYVTKHAGEKVTVTIQGSNNQTSDHVVDVRQNPPAGQGRTGISLALTGVISYPWYESVWRGVADAYSLGLATIQGFGMLLSNVIQHGKLGAEITGPIGIAKLTGQAAQVGFSYLLQFVAVISINLAVLNILPFPALDGGRAFLLIVEKIKGSPINKQVEMWVNTAGFVALLSLMLAVTARDLSKLF